MRFRCLDSLGMTYYPSLWSAHPRIKYGVRSESVEWNERESMGGLRARGYYRSAFCSSMSARSSSASNPNPIA